MNSYEKQLHIASYGPRVQGSVFKMEFRALSREFESIETFPRFVQLLGENWVYNQNKDHVGKKIVK